MLNYLKEDFMKILLIVISILLIAVVLLQAGKAEGAQSALTGGNDSLFKNRKRRGAFYNKINILFRSYLYRS